MLFLTSILIVLLHSLVFFALLLSFRKKDFYKTNILAKLSVVVAARDDEKNLFHLSAKLSSQHQQISETIIVDDYSSYQSLNFEKSFIEKNNNFKIIKNSLSPGKKNALTEGINCAKNEFVLITDADCLPEKKWTYSFLLKFQQGFDILFGIAPYIVENTFVSKVSGFENLRGHILSFAAFFYKMPYSAAARSFGFNKTSFEKISGYRNTIEVPFGDDDLLLREAVKHNLKIGAVLEKESFVFSRTKTTFKEYFKQRKRHVRTSFYYSGKNQLMLGIWHISNLLPLLIFLLLPLNLFYSLPLILKILSDSIILLKFQKKFGYDFNILEIIYLQFIYEILVIINFVNASFGKINWK